ncbi:MAG: CAP domain-containing protein [Acidimicrobiia bacterium]
MRLMVAVVLLAMAVAGGSSYLWVVDRADLAHQVTAMRAAHGLPPLQEAADLTAYANNHSWKMATHGSIWHSNLADVPGSWSGVGENVGRASEVWVSVRAMMDSPGHRQVLLGDWREIGYGNIRKDGQVYVTLVLRR